MRFWAMASLMHKDAIVDEAIENQVIATRKATRLIRLREVQHRVGLGRSTIYRWISEGKFPKPVQLGGYIVAWAEDDLEDWIMSRLERGQTKVTRPSSQIARSQPD